MTDRSTPRGKLSRAAGVCIRSRRQTLGWTQTQLGEHLGLTNASVSHIEKGANFLRLETLVLICHVMGVDPADMFAQILRLANGQRLNVPRETSQGDA